MSRTRIDSTHEHRQRQIIQDDDNSPIVTGVQTVRLLGPFTMTFAQANGDAVSLVTVPAGSLVVRAFARATADFDEEISVTIAIGSTLDPEDNHSLQTYNNVQTFDEFWGADREPAPASTPKIGFAITDADLTGALTPTGAPPTTGTVAFYALVAEPS